jgi:transcriptional antiterminator RfaH
VPWWCAQHQPNRARVAVGHLELLGFEVYLPRVLERRKNHGRPVTVEAELFPGYLFIGVTVTRQWHNANVAPGVIRLVRIGLTPTELRDELIEGIRQRERNGLVQLPERGLVPGARVRILAGPFANHLAIFSDMNGHARVGVLLNLFGAERRITVQRDHVEAAGG